VLQRIPLLLALLVASAALLVACGGGDDTGSTAADATSGGSPCENVDPPPKKKKNTDLPPPKADEPTAAGVTFDTSCGSFTVTFDDRAPKTAASFQYLAESGFYDDTVFHRVVPGFVIQGGDPLGSDPAKAGTGGPGYHVDEKPPADLSYTKGIVAMAKSQVEPPGRSGSQFYVVTGADAGLPPDYALVGEVTEGMDTVEAIDALGTPGADGPPTQTVVINSATPEG
jgi:peptidyl-prolyl cis-trans isomerase B (cyclophilin B)